MGLFRFKISSGWIPNSKIYIIFLIFFIETGLKPTVPASVKERETGTFELGLVFGTKVLGWTRTMVKRKYYLCARDHSRALQENITPACFRALDLYELVVEYLAFDLKKKFPITYVS